MVAIERKRKTNSVGNKLPLGSIISLLDNAGYKCLKMLRNSKQWKEEWDRKSSKSTKLRRRSKQS